MDEFLHNLAMSEVLINRNQNPGAITKKTGKLHKNVKFYMSKKPL